MLSLKDALSHAFWRGFFMHMFLNCMLQDWYGLDRYINAVREGWVNIYWWAWIPALLLLVWSDIYDKRRLNKGIPEYGYRGTIMVDIR